MLRSLAALMAIGMGLVSLFVVLCASTHAQGLINAKTALSFEETEPFFETLKVCPFSGADAK